jgi:para-nitrobenzyl esterase
MIFGQSGGRSKVCHLMAMPSAKGLFHRAAIESGAAIRSGTRENASQSADRLLKQLALPKSRFRELQEVPFEMIIGSQAVSGAQFGPMVDGTVVPRDPFEPDAAGGLSGCPTYGRQQSPGQQPEPYRFLDR